MEPTPRPSLTSHLPFDKGVWINQWVKDTACSKWCWKSWISVWKKNKRLLLLHTTLNTPTHTQETVELNVGTNTTKLLEENKEKLNDIG